MAGNMVNVEIPLYYAQAKRDGDRIEDLNSFCDAWAGMYEHLTTQTLTELEVLDVLKSGILQRAFGKNLEPVFVDALERAIKLTGDMTVVRRREIAQTLCHLPKECWADAFGEQLVFLQNTDAKCVAGFIQTQLNEARQEREEKIAKGELLTNAQWQSLCEIIEENPIWMSERVIQNLYEQGPNLPSIDLEDIAVLRPSTETAQVLVGECLRALHERAASEAVSQEHVNRIDQLLRCIVTRTDPSVRVARNIEAAVCLDFHKPFQPISDQVIVIGEQQRRADFPLIKVMEEIERKSSFPDCASSHEPNGRQGFWPRIMYLLHCVENIKKLPGQAMAPGLRVMPLSSFQASLDKEQQAQSTRLYATAQKCVGNPSDQVPVLGRAAFAIPMIEKLEQLAAEIDDVLTLFKPVEAGDVEASRSLLAVLETLKNTINSADIRTPLRGVPSSSYAENGNPYASTVESGHDQSTTERLRSNLGGWLQTTAGYLTAMGMTTLNAATGFVQQHPRAAATLALTAVYKVVNELYSQWLLPDGVHVVQQANSELYNQIINDVETSLSAMPEVFETFKERIANSTYENVHRDFRLVADIAHLLDQPLSWNQNVIRGELIANAVERARRDYVHHNNLEKLNIDEQSDIDAAITKAAPSQRSRRAAEWALETLSQLVGVSPQDQALLHRVIMKLKTNEPAAIAVPTETLIHAPLELYQQVVNDKLVLAFFAAKGLDLSTLRIYHESVTGFVTANGQTTSHTFTLWDNSGWWQAAKRLLPSLKLLDPESFGLRHMSLGPIVIRYEAVLAFYGVSQPSSAEAAIVLARQLETSGWPEFSAGKKARLAKAVEQVRQENVEASERDQLIIALELGVKSKADGEIVSLSETIAGFVSSSLALASEEIRHHLNDFLALPAMNAVCKARKIDCSAHPVRVTERKLQVHFEDKWVDLTGAVNAQPALKPELEKLFEQAKKTGNALYSSTSCDLLQIIRHMGFDAPENAGEIRNIIRWLTTAIPPSPPLGNYAADLLAGNSTSITLSTTEKTQVIDLSKVLVGGASSLIEALGPGLLDSYSMEYRRANADKLFTELLFTDEADSWGRQLLTKLKWYGATEGQTPSLQHYRQLVLTAIKLSIDPDAPGKAGTIAGYDVYQPDNRGRSVDAIRADIESHLINNKGISEQTAPLVAHLFLADVAPEFLVHNVGNVVRMGSINWMTLCLGVANAEAANPGCSRGMSDEQLMALAVLDPAATQESRLLIQSLGIDIMVAWGVMNGVIRQRTTSSYTPGDHERAATMFARQRAELTNAFKAFSEPLRMRRQLAIDELLKIFPGTSESEIKAMKLWATYLPPYENLKAAKGTTHDLVEVYMAGDLNTVDWWMPHGSISSEQWKIKIKQLPNLNTVFTASVDRYFNAFQNGFSISTKLLFSELPLQDRQCLELGTVELFTLRVETGVIKEDETPQLQASFRGGYGTLIRCEYRGEISYFEVFPAQMKIIKRLDLPDVIPLNGVIRVEKAKVSKGNTVNVEVQRGTNLPFDFQAYSTGSEPRAKVSSAKLIIEKLGNSFSTMSSVGYDDETKYVPNSYYSSKVVSIINTLINDNFLQGQKAFLFKSANGVTPREKQNQYWENVRGFLLQLLPFVGCVNDLKSGTRMGLINGAFGCLTDAVSSLFGLVGPAGKAVGVVTSVAPVAIKSFAAFKITLGTVISVVNPLSGLPDLIEGSVRGVRRFGRLVTSGVFHVTDNGISRLQNGLDHIRGFFGGYAVSAGKKLPWIDPEHAIFKGARAGSNATAIRQGAWWGIDDSGKPCGPALVDFVPDIAPVQ